MEFQGVSSRGGWPTKLKNHLTCHFIYYIYDETRQLETSIIRVKGIIVAIPHPTGCASEGQPMAFRFLTLMQIMDLHFKSTGGIFGRHMSAT